MLLRLSAITMARGTIPRNSSKRKMEVASEGLLELIEE